MPVITKHIESEFQPLGRLFEIVIVLRKVVHMDRYVQQEDVAARKLSVVVALRTCTTCWSWNGLLLFLPSLDRGGIKYA